VGRDHWNSPIDPHELEQMQRFSQLSLWEKRGWLEEAQRYVEHMKQRREEREKEKTTI